MAKSKSLSVLLPTVILLLVVNVASFVSQIILRPVFGSVGSSLHHYNGIFCVAFVTCLLTLIGRLSSVHRLTDSLTAVSLVLVLFPIHMRFVFINTARLGPILGPIITQMTLTWPCIFVLSHNISNHVSKWLTSSIRRMWTGPAFIALTIATVLTTIFRVSEQRFFVPYLEPYVGIYWSRFTLLVYLGLVLQSVKILRTRKSLSLVLCIVLIGFVVLMQRDVQQGIGFAQLPLPPEYTYLDRKESVTGILSVIENSEKGYRVLKCDHSLLGGLWNGLKRKELLAQGITVELEERSIDEAETVYSAFVLQEAVRLVRRQKEPERVLLMYVLSFSTDSSGLGVGISAKSFVKFDLDVTAVEIDPVVHQFAEKYFGLPKISAVYQDGRSFIQEQDGKWDFIVHDVFTGGSVPPHLFTSQMWNSCKQALMDDGVIVVVLFFLNH